jgi:hypothetical protein
MTTNVQRALGAGQKAALSCRLQARMMAKYHNLPAVRDQARAWLEAVANGAVKAKPHQIKGVQDALRYFDAAMPLWMLGAADNEEDCGAFDLGKNPAAEAEEFARTRL